MDFSSMSKEALENLKEQTEIALETIRNQELDKKRKLAEDKIKLLNENRDVILSLVEHDRTSCSDDNCCNGYSYSANYARCNKCHLIEILNGEYGNEFNISLSARIYPIA